MISSSSLWIAMPDALRGRYAPFFRREFRVSGPVKYAGLKICGLGFYEAWISGQRIGDHVLDPAQTDYEARCFFVSYDVTRNLRAGENAIGIILGDGFFNQDLIPEKHGWQGEKSSYGTPRLWAELTIRYADGSSAIVPTDETWKCSKGPIISSNIYAGEFYDARLEMPGWDSPHFRDAAWQPVEIVPPPGGRMEEQSIPPIRKIEEIRPISITENREGCWVADMGQNFAGWIRIRLRAEIGTEIRLRFAETVFPDGRIDTASTGVFATTVEQIDTYVCKGQGVETWEPRFTYHGFRYVEITGWPDRPGAEDITGVVVHTALPQAGAFKCSDERLNQLHRMAVWTHRSNIHGIPEDCPARERCGWLGDANFVCEYSIYNFQSMSFWEKYLDDIETTRASNGGLPAMIAPGKRGTRGAATPDWMAAFIQIPWYLYVYYGNRTVLERHWDGMCTVVEHYGKEADDWILSGGLGDWCDPRNSCSPTYTGECLTTTIWFWRCSWVMARVADLLDHKDDASRYYGWANRIRDAFRTRFYNRENGTFGSQTADAMALHFDLAPTGKEMTVLDSLVRDIRETNKLHHTVGIMGLRFLFEVLTRHGHGDTALALMHQNTYPSFGDLIGRNATTLWEYWGEPEVDKAHGPRSLNHPMMGGFDTWFYNTLAGIRPDIEHPGFRHYFLEPHPIPGLDWICAHYDSPQGRIVSEWQYANGHFEWKVIVPQGSNATATLPLTCRVRMLGSGTHRIVDEPID